MKSIRPRSIWLVALPVIVWALYGSFTNAPFAFDDSIHILRNPSVTSFKSVLDGGSWNQLINTPFGLSGRPLLMLTYGWNYSQSGSSPAAFRRTNLILHAVNSILVFVIVFELGFLNQRTRALRFWLALLAAAVFASNTMATESVIYIAGRSSSLCATFYFAGLYATLRAARAASWNFWALLLLSIGLTGAALLVKQDANILPAASVVMVWLAWPRDVAAIRRWKATAILAIGFLIFLGIQFQSLRHVSATTQSNSALVAAGYEPTLPFTTYMLTSIEAWSSYYFWRLWVPVWLSVDPEIAPIRSMVSPGLLISLVVILAVSAAALWFRERRPLIAAGCALIVFSPLSGYLLFPLADVVAEHRAYITLLGSSLVLAELIMSTRFRISLAVAALIAYGVLTVERNKVWADEAGLWEDAVRKAPDKVRPHLNLGAVYQARKETGRAVEEYRFILRNHPQHDSAIANLAALFTDLSEFERAQDLLDPAIARRSQFPPVYVALAAVRLRQNRPDDARTLLEQAYDLNPREPMIHHNRGDILLLEGRISDGVDEYMKELEINPDSSITHLHLANAYEVLGLRDKSIEQYSIVARMDPLNPNVQSALERLK